MTMSSSSNSRPSSHHGGDGHRPSDARRKVLADDLTVPEVSNFFPIERYYDAADKLFASVVSLSTKADALDNSTETLDACYVYGKRYCEFVLNAIPQHNYFGTIKYKNLRVKHTHQLEKVVDILERTADKMDQQELRFAQEAKLRKIAMEQERARQEQARLEAWQRHIQQQKKKAASSAKPLSLGDVEQSAMDKLKLLGQPQPAAAAAAAQVSTGVPVPPPPPSSTRYRFIDSDEDDDSAATQVIANGGRADVLPPPLLPPTNGDAMPPPSYDAVVTTTTRRTHKHLPFYAPPANDTTSFTVRPLVPPLEQQDEEWQVLQQQPIKPKLSSLRIPMRQQQEMFQTAYSKYQSAGRITVRPIATYQGRVSASTNGCTVISALTVARHLNHHNGTSCITDRAICDIIDQQCGPVLYEIRRKLGLGDHALIIPSDVHDHLVDAGILQQGHFSGAAGGNILDEAHMGEFLKLLASSSDTTSCTKAGATLFFREHVISIVKYRNGGDGANSNNSSSSHQYDLIDSMPTASTNNGRNLCASRTVCSDLQSLQVLLLYYASRKFSDSNCKTIDRNPWDDTMADLDPRVFQGFVWSTR